MSSRVTGAGLALIAVALLAVSLATPAVLPVQLSLFAGHPTVANHTRETQDVYVGLYTAELCNSGGDGTCKTGDATTAFRLCGYGELGLTGALGLLAVVLAMLTLRRSESRKGVARLVWLVGALAIAGVAALIVLGPFHGASAPVGIGMVVHGAGILGVMLGGAFAARPPPPIRLRVAERGAQPLALPTAQARDRRTLRNEAPPRAGDAERLGFEARTRPPPPPLDSESSDPFASPLPSTERSAPPGPQLRPLYDAAPLHGGTGGLLPPERPVIPTQPPPVSRTAPPGPPPFAPSGSPPPLAPSALPPPHPMAGMPPHPMAGMPPHPMAGMPPYPMAGMPPPRSMAGMPPHPMAGMPPHPMSGFPALPFSASDQSAVPPFIADEPHAAAPPFAADDPHAAALPFAADEPHAAAPPFEPDTLRPDGSPLDEPRMPPSPFASDPMRPTMLQPAADESHAIPPPFTDEPRQTAPRYSGGEPRPTAPRFPAGEPRTVPPPPPGARSKPPSVAPPLPGAGAPPPAPLLQLPHTGQAGHKPRTQVSLVPPMPDNDLPIAPPTAQFEASPEAHPPPAGAEPTLFPRAETPLAPPPLPVPPPPGPRPRRDSQLPGPLRGTQLPRPPLRAAVPMPARAGRTSPSPTQPPVPSTLRGVPLRPTISTTVPPIPAIPAIPAIPPIPAPRRADTDVTDPEGLADAADLEAATVSRVPIEVGEYDSQTHVSVDLPVPHDIDAVGGAARAGHGPDTSPRGEPLAPRAGIAVDAADQPTILGAAVIAASRPTVQIAEQRPDAAPILAAPPLSRTTTPQTRGSMPRLPISTAPDSLPPPKDNKQALGPSPACPQCESPMAWVEEHLRFYCKSCRMYF